MTFPLDDFIKKATAEGHSNEYLSETETYIKQLSEKGLPVLFSLEHLCLASQVNISRFWAGTKSNRQQFYNKFKLKKRNGGFRIIQVPDNDLKYLQKWILTNLLNVIPSHKACKGFDPKMSIKKNAECHLGKEAVLKIDLLRFYDSINERRIFGIFKSLGYHPNLAVSLAKICTVEPDNNFFIGFKKNELELRDRIRKNAGGILPQGAPTSPKISNLVANRLDYRLQGLCDRNGVSYTRYADDLTFSGSLEKLKNIKKIVYRIVKTEGFSVNLGKTKILVRGNKYFVTGLSIHNDVVRVPKKTKLEIEHHLFHCLKNGSHIHVIRSGIKNRNFKDWLLGSICFVYSIEEEVGRNYFEQFQRIEWSL